MKAYRLCLIALTLTVTIACTKQPEELECFIEPAEDAYDYPIKPGSPEWAQLTSSQQMDSVLQIPNDILLGMSTVGLVETCLSYPSFANIYFVDDYQWGFEFRCERFNGFQELLSRNDAAIKLFDRYLQMYPGCSINNWPSINSPGSSTSFSFAFIEIFLAQPEILQQLNDAETNALMQEVVAKYKQKKRYNYSIFSLKHTPLVAGRIMLLNNYPPFVHEYSTNPYVKDFVDRVMLHGNFSTLDVVIKHAHNYLN